MPFCTHCGKQVLESALFCQNCGSPQPVSPASGFYGQARAEDWMAGISPTTASVLCYIPFVGWIAALVVLWSQRFREQPVVRFHAFQGLYLFVLWLLVDMTIAPFFGMLGGHGRRTMSGVLHFAVMAGWIFMLVKTAQRELVRLPLLGELADRSVSEQNSGRF